MTLHIIVDTSVARACGKGNLAANSPAPQCIRILAAIAETDLRTAMCKELKDEWAKHAGEYARKWLGNMIARRRFTPSNETWPGHVELEAAAATLPAKQERAIMKDAHVVGLAMRTDRRVVSLDDAQLALLASICEQVKSLLVLHWINPASEKSEPWIRAGAPEAKGFCVSPSPTR